MPNAVQLSAIFRSPDLPFRPRHLAQFWVINTVKDDAVRAVEVYEALLETGGTSHAAQKFLILLQQSRKPFRFRYFMLYQNRKESALPG